MVRWSAIIVLLIVLLFTATAIFSRVSHASPEMLVKYGIISGTRDGKCFNEDGLFNIEQLSVILTRINRLETGYSDRKITHFSNFSEVSLWAKPFLNACVANHFFDFSSPGTLSSKDVVTGGILADVMLLSLGYRDITAADAEKLLDFYDLAVDKDKALTRKEAFFYIWKVLTKPVCSDGGYLIEKKGIATVKQLTEEGGVDDIVEYGKVSSFIDRENSSLKPEISIMHAGGELHGLTLTNTADALLFHYERGKRTFEIDFTLTSDGYYIGLHHWGQLNSSLFEKSNYNGASLSLDEFKQAKFFRNMKYIDLQVLENIVREYPDIVIVTDMKGNNVDFLQYLFSNYPLLSSHTIPQVYSRSEYEQVRTIGFEKIIYTLYRSKDTAKDVLDFIEKVHPYAVTIPWERLSYPYRNWKSLLNTDVNIFVHTVNSLHQSEMLLRRGVDGIYTDNL